MKCILLTIIFLQFEYTTCQSVKLVPGPDKGRLEVFHTGTWGTVCDSNFKNQAASVVCRSLGQPSNNSYWVSGYKFGAGSLKPRLWSVVCSGQESSLLSCSLTQGEDTSKPCSSTNYVVGIVCTNEKMRALIQYQNKWFDRPQQIDIFNHDHIVCWAGNDSQVRDFQCTLRSGTHATIYYSLPPFYAGQVTCSVSNWKMLGQDTLTVDIHSVYPPKEFVKSHVKVFEHTSANITLTNLPNPLPDVTTWRQTGRILEWNQTETYRMYKNISRADSGEFLVNISNQMTTSAGESRHGNGLELLFIDILYKPKVKCKQECMVTEGSKVNITCEVDANPPPYVYIWTDSSGNTVFQGHGPSLVIDSVRPQDAGLYKCTAVSNIKDSAWKTESGIGFAEVFIKLSTEEKVNNCVQDVYQVIEDKLPPTSTPLPVVAYAMTAVAVVSLIVTLMLSIIICRLRKTKDVPEVTHHRRDKSASEGSVIYENQGFAEEGYTVLDFSNGNRK